MVSGALVPDPEPDDPEIVVSLFDKDSVVGIKLVVENVVLVVCKTVVDEVLVLKISCVHIGVVVVVIGTVLLLSIVF